MGTRRGSGGRRPNERTEIFIANQYLCPEPVVPQKDLPTGNKTPSQVPDSGHLTPPRRPGVAGTTSRRGVLGIAIRLFAIHRYETPHNPIALGFHSRRILDCHRFEDLLCSKSSPSHNAFRQRKGGAVNSAVATEWQHFAKNQWFRSDPERPKNLEITRKLPINGIIPADAFALRRQGRQLESAWGQHIGVRGMVEDRGRPDWRRAGLELAEYREFAISIAIQPLAGRTRPIGRTSRQVASQATNDEHHPFSVGFSLLLTKRGYLGDGAERQCQPDHYDCRQL